MSEIQNLYLQFLANFPEGLRPIISLGLALLVVYSVFKVIKKDFVYIIALVVLLPASLPILKSIWGGILVFVKFLLNIK
ncbi:MAG: hypothetical protein M1333_01035 [Patescibacteria group bacterium]|nr:hypothetical protein [Patescibacteria group bacterium]